MLNMSQNSIFPRAIICMCLDASPCSLVHQFLCLDPRSVWPTPVTAIPSAASSSKSPVATISWLKLVFMPSTIGYTGRKALHQRQVVFCLLMIMNSMKVIIPLHFISWKKTSKDVVTPQRQSQFTLKMKANAEPRLLSSLVWIDQYKLF